MHTQPLKRRMGLVDPQAVNTIVTVKFYFLDVENSVGVAGADCMLNGVVATSDVTGYAEFPGVSSPGVYPYTIALPAGYEWIEGFDPFTDPLQLSGDLDVSWRLLPDYGWPEDQPFLCWIYLRSVATPPPNGNGVPPPPGDPAPDWLNRIYELAKNTNRVRMQKLLEDYAANNDWSFYVDVTP